MRRDLGSLVLGAVALLASVLVVGGALWWVQAIVAALIGLALAVQLLSRRGFERMSPLVLFLLVAIALTALQLLPLPSGVIEFLQPTASALRDDGAALAGTSPRHVLSMDPPGTMRALGYFVTLLGVALLALRLAASERGRFYMLAGVTITCGLAAIVSGLHMLVDADALYGIYTPQHTPEVIGPLLNPNHQGGLMAIGAVLGFGLAFYSRQPSQLRAVWIVIGFGCTILTALSTSRGAMVGLVFGTIVAASVLVASRMSPTAPRHHPGYQQYMPVAIVIGIAIAIALAMTAGNVVDQLGDTSVSELQVPHSKYAAWKSSLALIRETPWTGVGRGAIEPTLTRVHAGSAYTTFSHLENEYLSAVVEWGIIGALALAFAFVRCMQAAIRRWRDGALAAAALGALAMIMFQCCVDFGVELLGLGVPVTIIAASVQLVPLRPKSLLGMRIARVAVVAGLFGVAAMLLSPTTRTVQEDHDELLAEDPPTLEDVRASIERHPLDYFGFAESADLLSKDNDPLAVSYLNQALALHPTHPGLHQLAARMLVGLKNYHQAAFEYSLAMKIETAPRPLITEVMLLIPNPDFDAEAIPTDYPSIDTILHVLDDLKRRDVAERWLLLVAERPQHDLRVIDLLYDMAMTYHEYEVAKRAATLRESVAHTMSSRWMLANVEYKQGDLAAAEKELANVTNWNGRADEKANAWKLQCDIHFDRKLWNQAEECLHRLDASGLPALRSDIAKELDEIAQQRTYESKMEAAKALEESLRKPKAQGPASR